LQITIYTNYSTTTSIVKQTKLLFNSTNKLNFCLVYILIYLLQFRLNIYYKLKKQYIVLNILSRLLFNIDIIKRITNFDFDTNKRILNIYYIILVNISNNFKTKLKQIYKNNKQ